MSIPDFKLKVLEAGKTGGKSMTLRSLTSSLSITLSFLSSVLSSPSNHSLPLPVHIVHEFPKGTWVENLAIRSNGQVLATILTAPELYQVDPLQVEGATLVHTFPNVTGLLGIVETYEDVFYVVGGNGSTGNFSYTNGSGSVWRVDMAEFRTRGALHPASVTKVANLPQSSALNGMTLLDKETGLVLIADSGAGVLWRLNVNTGETRVIIDDPLFKQTLPQLPGINGINVRDGFLYFTNTGLQIVARLPINSDGSAAGKVTVLASSPADDFTIASNGNLYIAQSTNTIGFLRPHARNVTVLAGNPNSTAVAGPTACKFGRTPRDQGSLYISTTGGDAKYASGNFTIGGTISRCDVVLAGY